MLGDSQKAVITKACLLELWYVGNANLIKASDQMRLSLTRWFKNFSEVQLVCWNVEFRRLYSIVGVLLRQLLVNYFCPFRFRILGGTT